MNGQISASGELNGSITAPSSLSGTIDAVPVISDKLSGQITLAGGLTGEIDISGQLSGGINPGGDIPPYTGEYEITPLVESDQVFGTANHRMTNNLKVFKVPTYEVSGPTGGITLIIGGDG